MREDGGGADWGTGEGLRGRCGGLAVGVAVRGGGRMRRGGEIGRRRREIGKGRREGIKRRIAGNLSISRTKGTVYPSSATYHHLTHLHTPALRSSHALRHQHATCTNLLLSPTPLALASQLLAQSSSASCRPHSSKVPVPAAWNPGYKIRSPS